MSVFHCRSWGRFISALQKEVQTPQVYSAAGLKQPLAQAGFEFVTISEIDSTPFNDKTTKHMLPVAKSQH